MKINEDIKIEYNISESPICFCGIKLLGIQSNLSTLFKWLQLMKEMQISEIRMFWLYLVKLIGLIKCIKRSPPHGQGGLKNHPHHIILAFDLTALTG